MRLIRSKSFLTLLIFIILTISLRSDYRFVEGLYCCGDDHSYYVHSLTIVDDFDFNYNNQLEFIPGKVYEYKGKLAPRNFVGSGILSSMFMFLGKNIDVLLFKFKISNSSIMPYKLLFYSISPIFYLLFSILLFNKLIDKSKVLFKKSTLIILVFGSGVHYYAFERYSMTHVYEFFTVSLLLYLHYVFYNTFNETKKNLLAFLLPFIYLITYLVRYTNYFIFLIPFWIINTSVIRETNNRLHKNLFFYIGSFLAFVTNYFLSIWIYGRLVIKPQIAYSQQDISIVSWVEESFELNNLISKQLLNFLKIFYTQEFGILWFTPVLAFVILYLIKDTLINFKFSKTNLLILISFGIPIVIILLWETVASAYGIRYLYSAVPIAIYYLINISNKSTHIWSMRYLIFFSIFSFLAVLFFETTAYSSLAEVDQINSFGKVTRYAQPMYLSGVIKSFFLFDSYQIIFATSFFGAIIMKFFILIFGMDGFLEILSKIGLDISNTDVLTLLNKIELIDLHKFVVVIVIIFLISLKISKIIKSIV